MATGTFEKLKASEAPRRQRRSSSRMDGLPQWKLMRANLKKSKMAPNEVWQLSVTAEDKQKHGIKSRRTMIRVITNFLAENNLPYRVASFGRDEADIVQVRHTPAGKKSR